MFTPRDSARHSSVAFARSRCERETGSRPGYGEKKSGLVKCMYDGQSDANTCSSSVATPSRRSDGVLVGGDPQETLTVTWASGRTTIFTNCKCAKPSDPACEMEPVVTTCMTCRTTTRTGRTTRLASLTSGGTRRRAVCSSMTTISRCERVGQGLLPPGASTPACLSQEGAGAPLDPVAQSRRGRGSAIDVSRHRGHQVMDASAPSAYPSWCRSARSWPPEGGAGCFLPVTGQRHHPLVCCARRCQCVD